MIVAPYFHPKIGGLETYALNVARGLVNNGHKIVVVTSGSQKEKQITEDLNGIKIIRLRTGFKVSNTPMSFLWRTQLKHIVRNEKPDIINAHSPVPYIADIAFSVRGKIPFVLTYHAGSLKKGKSLIDSVLGLYEKTVLKHIIKRSDEVVSVYPSFIKRLVADSNPTFIPPGVDIKRFKPDKSTTPDRPTVLYVGRIELSSSWKGIDVLIQSMVLVVRRHPDAILKLVGSGDAVSHYEILVKKLGIDKNVEFAGPLKGKDLARTYQTSSLLVLPSLTDSESFGTVLIEAMAAGIPVIGSRIGGIPNVIEDDITGLLVQPGNKAELSKAILTTLNNRESTKKLVENSIKVVRDKYSLESLVSKTEITFTHLLKPRVLIIHNIVSPYRLPIFEAINEEVNLTVLFCKSITKDRVWKFDLSSYSFKYKILNGRTIGPLIINFWALPVLLRLKFDVVIFNNDPDVAPAALTAIVVAKLHKSKILNWSQITTADVHFIPRIAYGNSRVHSIARVILRNLIMAYRKVCFIAADRFVVLSKSAGEFLRSQGIEASRITVVDQVMPSELLAIPSKGIRRMGKTILYIGYLNERKGIDSLIQAFKIIEDSDTRLIIAGSGPTEAQLKELSRDDKRISFVGFVDGQSKADLYAQSDVFVLPTLYDVWGLVTNEAIHYGLVMVCSEKAESAEVVDTETGFVLNTQNVKALSQLLSHIIKQPELIKTISAHNMKVTSLTDTRNAARQFLQAIHGTSGHFHG